MYYNDFIRLRDSTANVYETWYDNESGSATKSIRRNSLKIYLLPDQPDYVDGDFH